MVILNLYGILFHAVLVFRPEHDFLFKSASSYCAVLPSRDKRMANLRHLLFLPEFWLELRIFEEFRSRLFFGLEKFDNTKFNTAACSLKIAI